METMKGGSSKTFSCTVQEKVEERPSSPADCAICLEQLTDKSFTNSCLHMFCFHCLLAWSKIKTECPLCKQDFCSIIHNIRSMTDYDEYHVPPAEGRLSLSLNPALTVNPDIFAREHDLFSNQRSFFSYRTTIMSGAYRLPRGRPDNLLIQPYVDNLEIQADFSRLNANPAAYSRCNRREIYIKELETLPPPSGGRYRECSPDFYRENEGQIHRLVRWLQRELSALSEVTNRLFTQELLRVIMDMLPLYHISSTTFFNTVNRYLGTHTARFIREFQHFATSPFEMDQYDRECIFVRQRNGSQLSFIVTVGRDDSEDVQIIPNSSNHSFRPWIDVNDLGRTRQSTTTTNTIHPPPFSCPHSNNYRARSATNLPSTSSTSQVINISDSENDDCVIIDQVRPTHETIILDDSEEEPRNTKMLLPVESPSCTMAGTRSTTTASYKPRISVRPEFQYPATCLPSTSNQPVDLTSELMWHSLQQVPKKSESDPQTVSKIERNCSSPGSSVLSTDVFSSETTNGKYTCRKSKRKRSKRYYRTKDLKRKQTSRKYEVHESSDDLLTVSGSSEVESDKNDLDWSLHKRKRKSTKSKKKKLKSLDKGHRGKEPKDECHKNSADEVQNLDTHKQASLPRLRSVVRKVDQTGRNNGYSIRRTSSNSSNSCCCRNFAQIEKNKNEPCTSYGIYNSHSDTCRLYSMAAFHRTIYSSDSD